MTPTDPTDIPPTRVVNVTRVYGAKRVSRRGHDLAARIALRRFQRACRRAHHQPISDPVISLHEDIPRDESTFTVVGRTIPTGIVPPGTYYPDHLTAIVVPDEADQ